MEDFSGKECTNCGMDEIAGYVDHTNPDGTVHRIYLCGPCLDAFRLGQKVSEIPVEIQEEE